MQTSEEVLKQQAQDAARRRAAEANKDTRPKAKLDFDDIRQRTAHYDALKESKPAPAPLLDGATSAPAPTTTLPARSSSTTTVAAPVDMDAVERHLDKVSPQGIAGHLLKLTQNGEFRTKDTDEKIERAVEFVCLANETFVGWQKFNGPGEPPDRIMGLLYGGFNLPAKDTLPDRDEALWLPGLSGTPEDPWKYTMCAVLRKVENNELYTFSTDSRSGCQAVTALLRHFNQMEKRGESAFPVVRLEAILKDRVKVPGTYHVPMFVIVGRSPKESFEKPDTSLEADTGDEIPF
jgi:hypothetical protein